MPQTTPRIAPLPLDQVPDETMALFGGRDNPRNQLNFFKILVQNPILLKKYEPFAMRLGREPSIPLRDKEVLILRTSTLCGETYELAHHLFIARQAGMTNEEIEAAKQGSNDLPPFERALVKAAEELVRDHCIADDTWTVLAARYTNSQLIELVFMVANYTLLAMINNSLGIYPEDEVEHAWKPTNPD
ncbi:carboxymuconolactone decarboxylase family protein [Novosphingobium sp.]|uniref:carboxymuconolactone decarboxylase family protein n=1 Tax=Novosphingobium sp. TaxID=1874826 RepID=UPI002736C8BE|nr:carboxymuconolactone decarboxylase family protein [Novosphingobium sp.]MDP3908702.1 carboxymuconolactone decarboxylase family protein [Novosphingobium sp.]